MNIWIKRFFIFLLPLAIICVAIVTVVALTYGEALPDSVVLALQERDENIAFDPKALERHFVYKLAALDRLEPELAFWGSSTSRYFQPFFIENPELAYNAFLNGMTIEEGAFFLKNMPEPLPKVIVYGIDVWLFAGNSTYNNYRIDNDAIMQANAFEQVITGTRDTVQDLVLDTTPELETTLWNREDPAAIVRLGLGETRGYLLGGGRNERILVPEGVRGWANRREKAYIQFDFYEGRFLPTTEIRSTALVAMEEILQFAQENDIILVGYTPPVIPRMYTELTIAPCYAYFPETIRQVSRLFETYNMPFVDLSSVDEIEGGSVTEMQDSHHASPILTVRLFRELVRRFPDILGEYSSLAYLDELLSQPQYQYEPVLDEITYTRERQFAAYLDRGVNDRECDHLEDALDSFNEALAIKPDNAGAYFQRGLVHHDLGNVEAAQADFEQYILLAEDSPNKERRIRIIEELLSNS